MFDVARPAGKTSTRSRPQSPVTLTVPFPKPVPIAAVQLQLLPLITCETAKGCKCACPSLSLPVSFPFSVCVWGGSSNMLPANSFSFHFSWHFYARMINYAILHLLQPELPPHHPPCPRGAALRSLSHQSASTLALSGNRRRLVPQLNFTAGVKVPQLAAIKKGCNQGWQHE